jgi:TrmH family RNA methyltransferase
MLSKNRKKFIRALAQKKVRQKEKMFLAEGDKVVRELLRASAIPGHAYRIQSIIATGAWLEGNSSMLSGEYEVIESAGQDLQQISTQKVPNQALAVVHIPPRGGTETIRRSLSLGLFQLRDPGNFGTILRVADWFGIRNIICSPDSVDLYNPKVIQASMGSFLRVSVLYNDLAELIQELKVDIQFRVYATGIQGSNLYECGLAVPGLILMGSESHGLPPELAGLSDMVLGIPFHDPASHAESLNVGVAGAIICAEFRRRGL